MYLYILQPNLHKKSEVKINVDLRPNIVLHYCVMVVLLF